MIQASRFKKTAINLLLMVTVVMLCSAGSASAAIEPPSGEAALLDTYNKNSAKLKSSSFGIPLFLNSSKQEKRVHIDVYGIFASPFSNVVSVLKTPANW